MSNVNVSNNTCYDCFQSCGTAIKEVGKVVGKIVVGAVILVAHPIIGPIGSIGCLFTAAYHGVLANYHWRHTHEKDDNGNLIPGTSIYKTNYMFVDVKFNLEDLSRLQSEEQRVYHAKAAIESLKWARGLAIFSLPISGPIFAIFLEINSGGCLEKSTGWYRCGQPCHEVTREEKLQEYITQIRNPDQAKQSPKNTSDSIPSHTIEFYAGPLIGLELDPEGNPYPDEDPLKD